ncbi:hypothetical protein [Mycoplasma buteonis]|uniref:hypothetical protein n=1 Tax=Mycoplasma buteonis TaxID=171280 RepID=UPI000567672E|nr:hypothetical protein [Mycoplasma buteonis]
MKIKHRVYKKNSFSDLKKLALLENKEIQKEWEWINKITKQVHFRGADFTIQESTHKTLGLEPETILSKPLEALNEQFINLENALLLQKGCFMDTYSFESNQINWLMSLIDQNSVKETKNEKIDMTNTTRIIVNKLDI